MNKNFPRIETIDDVLPYIEGREEFVVRTDDFYTVINYNVTKSDTFFHEDPHTQAIRRECRGIAFDKKGKILSRRLHKFFNYGENAETQPDNVDFTRPHMFMDKRDGSMITPLVDQREHGRYVTWGTKAGVSDVSKKVAWRFTADKYRIFALACHDMEITPIFEYTSPDNQIVLKYDEPELVLLHIRYNISGEYMDRDFMRTYASAYGIPVVNDYDHIDIGTIPGMKDIEGYIIRFYNGHMLKIKTDQYRAAHRAKDNILHEKEKVRMILEGTIDDVFPALPDEDRAELMKYIDNFHNGVRQTVMEIDQYCQENKDRPVSEIVEEVKTKFPELIRTSVFRHFRNHYTMDELQMMIHKVILFYCGSGPRLDMVRFIWEK